MGLIVLEDLPGCTSKPTMSYAVWGWKHTHTHTTQHYCTNNGVFSDQSRQNRWLWFQVCAKPTFWFSIIAHSAVSVARGYFTVFACWVVLLFSVSMRCFEKQVGIFMIFIRHLTWSPDVSNHLIKESKSCGRTASRRSLKVSWVAVPSGSF